MKLRDFGVLVSCLGGGAVVDGGFSILSPERISFLSLLLFSEVAVYETLAGVVLVFLGLGLVFLAPDRRDRSGGAPS